MVLLACNLAFAQKESGNFKLLGVVVDSASGNGIKDANILILSRTDNKNLGGAATDKSGKFIVDNITQNNVRVKFSMVGYQTKVIDSLSLENISRLGVIKLKPTLYEIPEIVIKTIKPMIETHVDKQVINIDQVPAGSGSLTDVLKNSGAVDVDPQTNAITVRGEAVKIQMDGRPYEMPADMLAQLPANTAEQVEVILAPSAKESAEGGTYILNIISKKNILESYSGSASLNTSTNKRFFGGLNLNYKTSKLNIFSSFFGANVEYITSGVNEKVNFNSNSFHDQKSTSNNSSKFSGGFYKLGIDYTFDENNSVTFTGQYNGFTGNSEAKNSNFVYDNSSTELYNFASKNLYKRNQDYVSLYGFYKRKFDTKGKELTIDVLFTRLRNPINTNLELNYSNKNYLQMQNSTTSDNPKTFVLKTEFVTPTEIGKLETGYNLTLRDRDNNYNTLDYLNATNTWVDTSQLSNYFKYKENINAVYLTYSNSFGKFEVKTGVRMENLNTEGDQLTTHDSFLGHFLNFFPNFNLSYKINDLFQLTFNTFKRVNYPNLNFLNPFKKYSGPNDYSAGNPKIQPQYTTSYSIKLSPFLDAYYVHFTNNINYATAVINDSVSYSSPINLSSINMYGVELTLPYYNTPMSPIHLPDFISMCNVQFGYTYRQQYGQYLNEDLTYSYESKWINLNLGLNLWYDVSANLMFRYRPENSNAKGYNNETKEMALSFSKSLMDQKLKINFSISDLLNSQKYINKTYGNTYYSSSTYLPNNTRSISIGITYMFNDYKERRDRNIDDGRDGGNKGF